MREREGGGEVLQQANDQLCECNVVASSLSADRVNIYLYYDTNDVHVFLS